MGCSRRALLRCGAAAACAPALAQLGGCAPRIDLPLSIDLPAPVDNIASVPVSRIPELIEHGAELIRRLAPEGQVVSYGHVGDGNLHFNVSQRPGTADEAFLARAKPLESAMFDLVESLGGSISAEHGIGRLKAAELAARADPTELSVMRAVKHALDPKGILNPGKVLA